MNKEDIYKVKWHSPQECKICHALHTEGIYIPKNNEAICNIHMISIVVGVKVSDLMQDQSVTNWNS